MQDIFNKFRYILDKLDYTLMTCIILLFTFSLFAIYSAAGQYSADPTVFLIKQAVWFAIGLAIMFGMLFLEYEHYRVLALPLYIVGILSLVAVAFVGTAQKGSQRWLSIGGAEIQPSEFVKIILIIMLATTIYKVTKRYQMSKWLNLLIVGSIGIVAIIPFYFILDQPDLGTALVTIAISGATLLVSGVSFFYLAIIVAMFVGLILLLAWIYLYHPEIMNYFLKDHQLDRIYGWLQPDEYAGSYGYQLSGARMGIGSGGLTGNGFQHGVVSQSGRVPEIHTDFIFTVIGEEFGFIGAAVLLLIFFILIYRMIVIAMYCKDKFGTYLIAGIVGLFTFQIFQNIGMTIGVMPITGLTLPLVSYGGSSLLTSMIAIGIVMNVYIHTKNYMFSTNEI